MYNPSPIQFVGGGLIDEATALKSKAATYNRKRKSVQLQITTLQKLPQPWDGVGVLSPHLR